MDSQAPIRVEVIIDTLTWGGAEMLLTEFATAAPGAGIDLSVTYLKDFHGSPAAPRLRALGVNPVLVPITRLHDPEGVRRVTRHLADVRPDLVHTHLGYSDLVGGWAARRLGIPSVSTLHLMEWEGDTRERTKQWLMARARRRCAARVVAVSEAGRQAYLARFRERPGRVAVVRNGIVGEPASGEGAGVREELGIGADELVVAMLTVLRRGKGHDVAAAAVTRLQERHSGLRLLVCGEGPDRSEIERALAPLGDAVVDAGHREDVMRVLDAVDVLVHPTRMDALPTALLEAMAASVAVVASRVGGIPEIVAEGRTGMLVEAPPSVAALAAALEPLLVDAGLRQRLGVAGRERFEEEFSARRWAERLRSLYDQVTMRSCG